MCNLKPISEIQLIRLNVPLSNGAYCRQCETVQCYCRHRVSRINKYLRVCNEYLRVYICVFLSVSHSICVN